MTLNGTTKNIVVDNGESEIQSESFDDYNTVTGVGSNKLSPLGAHNFHARLSKYENSSLNNAGNICRQ